VGEPGAPERGGKGGGDVSANGDTPEQDAFTGICMECAGYRVVPIFDGNGNEIGTQDCPSCNGTGTKTPEASK
jgi:hypothetical protein